MGEALRLIHHERSKTTIEPLTPTLSPRKGGARERTCRVARAPLPRRLRLLAAAIAGGLIGDPRVMRTIGQARERPAAAAEEFRAGGIAARPAARGPASIQ